MAFCGKCGTELAQDACFCAKCGASVAANSKAEEAVSADGNADGNAEENVDFDDVVDDISYTYGNSYETPTPYRDSGYSQPPNTPSPATAQTSIKYLITSIILSGLVCVGAFFMPLAVGRFYGHDTGITAFKFIKAIQEQQDSIERGQESITYMEQHRENYSEQQIINAQKSIDFGKVVINVSIGFLSAIALVAVANGFHIIKAVVSSDNIIKKGDSILGWGRLGTIVFGLIIVGALAVPLTQTVLGPTIIEPGSGTIMCAVACFVNIILGVNINKAR